MKDITINFSETGLLIRTNDKKIIDALFKLTAYYPEKGYRVVVRPQDDKGGMTVFGVPYNSFLKGLKRMEINLSEAAREARRKNIAKAQEARRAKREAAEKSA